jgi:hypothetical protein
VAQTLKTDRYLSKGREKQLAIYIPFLTFPFSLLVFLIAVKEHAYLFFIGGMGIVLLGIGFLVRPWRGKVSDSVLIVSVTLLIIFAVLVIYEYAYW